MWGLQCAERHDCQVSTHVTSVYGYAIWISCWSSNAFPVTPGGSHFWFPRLLLPDPSAQSLCHISIQPRNFSQGYTLCGWGGLMGSTPSLPQFVYIDIERNVPSDNISGMYTHLGRYQIFWEVVGLERDPLSLVSTIQELLERESSGSGLEIRDYGRRDLSRWPRGTLYPQKLALTSPTSGGRSVCIVRSRTRST
jgi:hypothetical protein